MATEAFARTNEPLAGNVQLQDSSNMDQQHSRSKMVRLIDAARSGNGEALGELLVSYRKYVVFLARTQLHHHMQAKADPSDIAQEVFLAAHRNIGEFRGQSAEEFARWLRSILSNTLATHVRKFMGTQKRDPRLELQLNQSLASASGFLESKIASDATSPSQQFARDEAFLHLAVALESLSDDYRQVIILRHIDGLPFAEIAKLMSKSIDSVEKLWVRGLAKLKSIMGDS